MDRGLCSESLGLTHADVYKFRGYCTEISNQKKRRETTTQTSIPSNCGRSSGPMVACQHIREAVAPTSRQPSCTRSQMGDEYDDLVSMQAQRRREAEKERTKNEKGEGRGGSARESMATMSELWGTLEADVLRKLSKTPHVSTSPHCYKCQLIYRSGSHCPIHRLWGELPCQLQHYDVDVRSACAYQASVVAWLSGDLVYGFG